jgi:hypothetical protein
MSTRWTRAALCRRFSHLPWLANAGDMTGAQVESMRTVCEACPVERECAAFVRAEGIDSGFWAGSPRTAPPPASTGGAA